MSYDITFKKDKNICVMNENAPEGGTFAMGGTNEAWINVTFNYCTKFSEHGISMIKHENDSDDVSVLNGKTAKECVDILKKVIPTFDEYEISENYWEPTENNCAKALKGILFIAERVPCDAVCSVSC